MIAAERSRSNFVEKHGHKPFSTDGGSWYPQACKFLKLEHHIHPPYEKILIERLCSM